MSMAWCPVAVSASSAHKQHQYLAVHTQSPSRESYGLVRAQTGPSLIQFWNFGAERYCKMLWFSIAATDVEIRFYRTYASNHFVYR